MRRVRLTEAARLRGLRPLPRNRKRPGCHGHRRRRIPRYFGDRAFTIDRQSASEDFSEIPDALRVPYTYWGVGCVDPASYAKAEAAGSVATDIPANHSPNFAPVIEPTLETGTAAAVVAALAWLAAAR